MAQTSQVVKGSEGGEEQVEDQMKKSKKWAVILRDRAEYATNLTHLIEKAHKIL